MKIIILVSFLVLSYISYSNELKHFVGEVNSKYKIEMQLSFLNNEIEGSYYYINSGKEIFLKGTYKNKIIELEEYINNKVNAKFKGVIDNDKFTGEWVSEKKNFKFSLIENYDESVKFNIITDEKEFRGKNGYKRERITTEFTYYEPIVYNNNQEKMKKLNKILKDLMIETIGEDYDEDADKLKKKFEFYSFNANMKIEFNNKNILCVSIDSWNIGEGMAHGKQYSNKIVIDLAEMKIVKLSDLFEGDYENILKKILLAKLDGDIYKSEFKLRNFYLNNEGIFFDWDVEEIAFYSEGFKEAFIKYSEIPNSIIKNNSIFKRFIRKNK